MQIVSFIFFGMVALLFGLLYLCGRLVRDPQKSNRIANGLLLIASYLFVLYGDWRFALVLFAVTLITWLTAIRGQVMPGVIAALAALAFFKYTNFFSQSFASLLGQDFTALHIILPLGISFYTFSAIGYLLDVRRGKTVAHGLGELALYLAFFPKITSGPIQKSGDFFRQAEQKRMVGWQTFQPGIQIFAFGLFKKIVLADHLSVFVDQVYATPNAFGSGTVLLAAFSYSLQIYFDFSGYSDMAIGTAKILGFDLPRNFNLPYLAHNVTEFWKRWHMTLSAWLQEYLYISLGGNRKGRLRTYLNLILTMVLGGIWHGASWTYVIWGLLHGLALAVHKLWMKLSGSAGKVPGRLTSLLSMLLTFLFVSFCWIFFRAETLSQAMLILTRIFSFEVGLEQPYFWLFAGGILLIMASILARVASRGKCLSGKYKNVSLVEGYYPVRDLTRFWNLVWFFAFAGLILCLAYTGGSPFIYGNY